jgi:pyruvate/2-oxoglutarate dehydrogenase complex dihydrolipoamide acyltransferase (E2) component
VPAVRIDPIRARRRTGELMAQAQREIPVFHVNRHARAEALVGHAKAHDASLTAALLAIVAPWLQRHRLLNAHWIDDLRPIDRVDLGVAVAHRENVLVVPTLRDCADWDTARFADELVGLRERSAADGFLPSDFAIPTFTVSNLGAARVDSFTSLVTPPQVGVLSVASAQFRAVAFGERLEAARTLPLTLGADHRAVDGAYVAAALDDLIATIEGATP